MARNALDLIKTTKGAPNARSLLGLLGDWKPGHESIVEKGISLAAARAIVAIGGYEHADVVQRLIDRDPPKSDLHIFKYLNKAISYKHEGCDFKVLYEDGGRWEVEANGYEGGRTGYKEPKLIIYEGEKLK